MKFVIRTFAVAALAMLCFQVAFAGVAFKIEVKHHKGEKAEVQNIDVLAEDQNVKMNMTGKGKRSPGSMIFLGERGEMIMVDDEDKSYMVMDKETMEKMGSQLNEAMSQLDEALKNVPPEQRAMMEKMMKKRMPNQGQAETSKSELKKTGESKTINGYDCVKYETLRDGKKEQELWVTSWDNIEGGKEAATAFEQMAVFFKDLMDSFSKAGGPLAGMMNRIGSNAFEHVKEMNGVPVYSKSFASDGSLESESTLVSSEQQDLSAVAFQPPEGYKKREMMAGGR